MARNFTEIAFTPGVKKFQERYNSRRQYEKMSSRQRFDGLSDEDEAFIKERDTFFMASVGTNDWPYVQHRGGPQGFLKVLDRYTLAFADFRGNKQYISVGNMSDNQRVSLILLDFVNRERLKIWGQASVVDKTDDPNLLTQLQAPDYPAQIERGIVIRVEAVDWNCRQHIVPRFTEEDVAQVVGRYKARIKELEGLCLRQAS